MILDALICTNFDKFKDINSQIGHITTFKLYVKLSYLARMSPAKIQILNICNQMNITRRSFHRYTLRLFVQGLLENQTQFDSHEKALYIAIPKGAPKLTINFRKLKKLEAMTQDEDEAFLLSHIAYETKYKHNYPYSLREIGQIFGWKKDKTIEVLKRLKDKNFIEISHPSRTKIEYKLNIEHIKNIYPVDNFRKSVDNYAKPVDKSVDNFANTQSYPQVKCQKPTSKMPKTDKLDHLFLIIRNIRRNIIINIECSESAKQLSPYERAVQIFFINTPLLTEGLDRLKKEIEVGWETAEWLAQIRYSALKTISKYPERNLLNLICSCIKLACEKKWGVPGGFYESEEGRPYYEHIERQMREHEELKWGGVAANNPVHEMCRQMLPRTSSMRPP